MESKSLAALRADPERLLTQADLCGLLDKSESWAERARCYRTGPRFIKIGRTPVYRAGDVLEFVLAGVVETRAA